MRGVHNGTLTIEGRFEGMLNGNGIVPAGAAADVAGMINGMLIVEPGAVVTISGMVNGQIVNRGGTIEVSGMAGPVVAG